MSAPARIGFVGACTLALAAVAFGLAGLDGEDRDPAGAERGIARADAARERLQQAVEARHRHELRRTARREDPHGEPGPTAATPRIYARANAAAEPVARRFHAAFARYELGLGGWRRDLAATAEPALVRDLVAAPPRVMRGSRPERARLGRVELVPLSSARPSPRLRSIELVGTVHRGGRREPIALELRRRDGRWLVAELGL